MAVQIYLCNFFFFFVAHDVRSTCFIYKLTQFSATTRRNHVVCCSGRSNEI